LRDFENCDRMLRTLYSVRIHRRPIVETFSLFTSFWKITSSHRIVKKIIYKSDEDFFGLGFALRCIDPSDYCTLCVAVGLHAVEQHTRRSAQGGRRNAPGSVQASPPCWRLQSRAALPRAINTTQQTDRQRSSSSSTGGLRSCRTCVHPDSSSVILNPKSYTLYIP
jgi:hypothetical protein